MSEDLAWAAGLFEGEGCFTASHKPPKGPNKRIYVQTSASLTMTDRDVVERFQKIIGFGSFYDLGAPRPGAQRVFRWSVQDRSGVKRFYDLIEPWLGQRRKARGLEILSIPVGTQNAVHQSRSQKDSKAFSDSS